MRFILQPTIRTAQMKYCSTLSSCQKVTKVVGPSRSFWNRASGKRTISPIMLVGVAVSCVVGAVGVGEGGLCTSCPPKRTCYIELDCVILAYLANGILDYKQNCLKLCSTNYSVCEIGYRITTLPIVCGDRATLSHNHPTAAGETATVVAAFYPGGERLMKGVLVASRMTAQNMIRHAHGTDAV